MAELCNNSNEHSKDIFNALSFERKLVELVEELRLRRNLEIENENTLKSVMDEKYKEELNWDEQHRRHITEKDDLDQQIELLKRKLEDKVCVSDDDKAKQHVINRTYSHELRMLKEELRTSKSEKLNLQKKVQELEGKLNLHNKFQESIVSQINEVRKTIKLIVEEGQQLTTTHKNVMENVVAAKLSFRKFDLCNQHLQQSIAITGKKSEALKKELVSCRCELALLKQSVPMEKKKPKNGVETEKLQKKILELENVLLLSQKENEKTLSNFLQSNEMLCQFMNKYSENQEREKTLEHDIEWIREKLTRTERKLQETTEEMNNIKELEALKKKERIDNQSTAEVQTEVVSSNNKCCFCNTSTKETSKVNLTDVMSPPLEQKDSDKDAKIEPMHLQHNSVLENDFIPDFSTDPIPLHSGDGKMTLGNVLKRKTQVMESGVDSTECVSPKKRLIHNGARHTTYTINGTGDNHASSISFDGKFDIHSETMNIKNIEMPEIPTDHENLRAPAGTLEEMNTLEVKGI